MPKKSEVMRECCLTRETRPASELIRFALGPDDEVVPDVDAKAPGRGVWVTLSEAMVAEAVRKKAFARGFKQAVKVPPELALLTRSRLEERLKGALGLARKAGQIVTGAAKVEATVIARSEHQRPCSPPATRPSTGDQNALTVCGTSFPQGDVGHLNYCPPTNWIWRWDLKM